MNGAEIKMKLRGLEQMLGIGAGILQPPADTQSTPILHLDGPSGAVKWVSTSKKRRKKGLPLFSQIA